MGFIDKIRQAILGSKEKAADAKYAAARAERKVDGSANKAKRAANESDDAVEDAAAGSNELKKD